MKPNFEKLNVHYVLDSDGNIKQFPSMRSLLSYTKKIIKIFGKLDSNLRVYRVHVYDCTNFKDLL